MSALTQWLIIFITFITLQAPHLVTLSPSVVTVMEAAINISSHTNQEMDVKVENENFVKDKELEDGESISPKQCHKLQFSIAQIMGFDRGETKEEADLRVVKEEEEDDQPVKLWRPLAQPSASTLGSAMSPLPQFPSEYPNPAALALLRQYTFFRFVLSVNNCFKTLTLYFCSHIFDVKYLKNIYYEVGGKIFC